MSNFENNFNEQKNIILQIDNLKKTFKDNISGESLTIIDGLSMKVFEGSKNIIIGESGSGKSTLLNIIGALDSLMENPGHPGGMFWVWKFSYDTGGKQANARDSAKNAKYMPITEGNYLNVLNPAKATLDKAAAEFTNEKAAEVIISNQYMYKEDLEEKVNKIMAKTRNLLSLSETESLGAPALGANPLASFGALPDAKAPAGDFGLTFGE